jgi:hypothetical protein
MQRLWRDVFAATLMLAVCASLPAADTKKADDKNPLSKFSEEKLVDIGFCFDEFCKAVAAKDAKVVKAFLVDVPKSLEKLDLNKDADKEAFIKYFAKFSGANVDSAQKMHGMGEVTYTDKDGKKQTQRMELQAGVWKMTGL